MMTPSNGECNLLRLHGSAFFTALVDALANLIAVDLNIYIAAGPHVDTHGRFLARSADFDIDVSIAGPGVGAAGLGLDSTVDGNRRGPTAGDRRIAADQADEAAAQRRITPQATFHGRILYASADFA